MPRRLLILLGLLGVWGMLLAAGPAAAEATWGDTGADYSAGLICQLPGDTQVAMVEWTVDGHAAFAVDDVAAEGGKYGPAPVTGPVVAPSTQDASIAYLIAHAADGGSAAGAGSAVRIAETSADIAAQISGGPLQQQCLGQQGTSAAAAAALLQQAQTLAGPYTVAIKGMGAETPGSPTTLIATVTSASGAVVPGMPVTFVGTADTSTATATATTGTNGVATARLLAPAVPSFPVTATVSAPTQLIGLASTPQSLALAPPSTFSGSITLAPTTPPHPSVSVSAARQLLLQSGSTPIGVTVSGSEGFPTTAVAELAGPVTPKAGAVCSSLGAADFAHAAQAWTGQADVTGDGEHTVGTTDPLAPGCYAASATVTTVGSVGAPATAKSTYTTAATVTVTQLALVTAVHHPIAAPGPLAATVTASHPAGATLTATVTAVGPLAPRSGQCPADLAWSQAAVSGFSDQVGLGGAGEQLTAQVTTPTVSTLGCYALVSHTTLQIDGRSLTVASPLGSTTVLVLHPTITIADGAYDVTRGGAMTGTVGVWGSQGRAGTVQFGLMQRSVPAAGADCHGAWTGGSPVPIATTTVGVHGDGSYAFHAPAAPANTCYAVTARLVMADNTAVTAPGPDPAPATQFLAGVTLTTVAPAGPTGGSAGSLVQPLVVFSVAMALTFGLAAFVGGWAYLRRYPVLAGLDDLPRLG